MGKVRPLRSHTSVPIVDDLMESWVIHMEAAGTSQRTITIYTTQVKAWRAWCEATDQAPLLTRDSVVGFLAAERARGMAANTVKTRFRGLSVLASWLNNEGLTQGNVLKGVKVATPVTDPPPVLDEEELALLLKACSGRRFIDRRDSAIARLLMDTGMRASECVGLELDDLSLRNKTVTVTGKGGRKRTIPYGGKTAVAIDRYVRLRRVHKYADSKALWLSERGALKYDGLAYAMEQRAKVAGIQGFHLHRLRHTLAHRWMAAGGSELGLQDIGGWSSSAMIARYGASARAERAASESRRLNLNEDL